MLLGLGFGSYLLQQARINIYGCVYKHKSISKCRLRWPKFEFLSEFGDLLLECIAMKVQFLNAVLQLIIIDAHL